MLIALEGIDGAGKSTVAPLVVERLGAGARLWRKKDFQVGDPAATARLHELHDLIWRTRDEQTDPMGTPYHLFLHAAWFAALHRHRTLSPGEVAVADGWFYRSVAKAMIRDRLPEQWCRSLFEMDGPPGVVVFLDVDPEVAWHRGGGRFAAFETGRWDGRDDEPRDAFCAYQSAVAAVLRDFARRAGWVVVRPESSWSAERVADAVTAPVLARMGGGARPERSEGSS